MSKAKGNSPWQDEFYVTVYALRRSGCDAVANAAGALGVTRETFNKWLATKPAFKDAWERGAEDRGGGANTFREYVYMQLPPKLQETWDEIDALDQTVDGRKPENGFRRIQSLMEAKGVRAQQHLFLYALTATGFNASEALRRCGLSKSKVDGWAARDPDFASLIEEIHWHKKNFYESSLIGLVMRGDPAATVFANRTINRDRGYADKQVVEHTGSINHNHTAIPMDALVGLPPDVLRQVLDAVRAHLGNTGAPRLPGEVGPAYTVDPLDVKPVEEDADDGEADEEDDEEADGG